MGQIETADGLEYADEIIVRRADDGGLVVEGYEGTFYRVGEGKGADRFAAFAPFMGSWENSTAGSSLQIQGGAYGEHRADGGVSMGSASVTDGKLSLGGSEATLDPATDTLTVEGVEGVYHRVGAHGVPAPLEKENGKVSEAAKALKAVNQVLEGIAEADKTAQKTLKWSAEDADLDQAPDVIVEGSPPNLGGWHGENTVVFHVEVEEAGDYAVTLNYSKQASDGDRADLKITAGGESFAAPLPPTGSDWSNYVEHEFCTLPFPAGKTTITIESTRPRGGSYVMNLRSVTLSRP
jgi:hypothetical protein